MQTHTLEVIQRIRRLVAFAAEQTLLITDALVPLAMLKYGVPALWLQLLPEAWELQVWHQTVDVWW